jgi:hypothetical protein
LWRSFFSSSLHSCFLIVSLTMWGPGVLLVTSLCF